MIQTHHLSKRFGSVAALTNLDLTVQAGEIFGFLGPNGAGKTTTIRLLLGLLTPTGGSCRVLGHDVASEATEVRRRSGALLEATGLYEDLSVVENLRFFARIQGVSKHAMEPRIGQELERFGLGQKRHHLAGSLSCGMKQKLGIARALLHRPRLLFLDEPTRGLDPAATVELRRLLTDLARDDGVTLFITSHNLAEIERCCDRVGLILGGHLQSVDSVEQFCRTGEGEVVTLRATAIPPGLAARFSDRSDVRVVDQGSQHIQLAVGFGQDVTPLIRLALHAGASIQEVRREQRSLEDAYMNRLEQPA